jgi:uncharacterized membrane protein
MGIKAKRRQNKTVIGEPWASAGQYLLFFLLIRWMMGNHVRTAASLTATAFYDAPQP